MLFNIIFAALDENISWYSSYVSSNYLHVLSKERTLGKLMEDAASMANIDKQITNTVTCLSRADVSPELIIVFGSGAYSDTEDCGCHES